MQYYFTVDVTDTTDVPRYSATLLGALINEFADDGHTTVISAETIDNDVHILASVWLATPIPDDVLFKIAPAFYSAALVEEHSVLIGIRHDATGSAQNSNLIILNPNKYGRVETLHLTYDYKPVVSYFAPTGSMMTLGEGTSPILTFEQGRYIRVSFLLCADPLETVEIHRVSGYPDHHDCTQDEDVTAIAPKVLKTHGFDWPFILATPFLAGLLVGIHLARKEAVDATDFTEELTTEAFTRPDLNPDD